jgi:hypothetical protein
MADFKITTTTYSVRDHLFDLPGTHHTVAVDAIQYAIVPYKLNGTAKVKVAGQRRMHRTEAGGLLRAFAQAGADLVGVRLNTGALAVVQGKQIASATARLNENDTAVTLRLKDGQRLQGHAAPEFCEGYLKIAVAEAQRPCGSSGQPAPALAPVGAA